MVRFHDNLKRKTNYAILKQYFTGSKSVTIWRKKRCIFIPVNELNFFFYTETEPKSTYLLNIINKTKEAFSVLNSS